MILMSGRFGECQCPCHCGVGMLHAFPCCGPEDGPYQPAEQKQQDICRNNHGGDPCSEAANDSIAEHKDAIRDRILQYLIAVGGATCDQVEQALGIIHQTASARLGELCSMGLAYKSLIRRTTRSGKSAWVIKAVENGSTVDIVPTEELDVPPAQTA